MGALTRLRPIDDVIADIDTGEPVAVISCNNCVKVSGAGGEGVWEGYCHKLRERGVRIEQEVLITNPCSRGYFENMSISPAVKTVVLMACRGAQSGFHSLFSDKKLVSATETMGLFIASAREGAVKLAMAFPDFKHWLGKDFALGNTAAGPLPEQKLDMGIGQR
jgi:hypothetical protein